jgi:hypothetical protein
MSLSVTEWCGEAGSRGVREPSASAVGEAGTASCSYRADETLATQLITERCAVPGESHAPVDGTNDPESVDATASSDEGRNRKLSLISTSCGSDYGDQGELQEPLAGSGDAGLLQGVCERCRAVHDRSYGSGRFCSVQCARKVAAKAKWERHRSQRRDTVPHETSKGSIYEQVTERPGKEHPHKRWRTCALSRTHEDAGRQALLASDALLQRTRSSHILGRLYPATAPGIYLPYSWTHLDAQLHQQPKHGLHEPEAVQQGELGSNGWPLPGHACTAAAAATATATATVSRGIGQVPLPPFSVAFRRHCAQSTQHLCRSVQPLHCREQNLPSFEKVLRFAKAMPSIWSVQTTYLRDPFRYTI